MATPNPDKREFFHQAILSCLDQNQSRFGLQTKALAILLNAYAFSPDLPDLERGLEYLEGKGLVAPAGKVINPENRAWRITAAGTDYLRERGL